MRSKISKKMYSAAPAAEMKTEPRTCDAVPAPDKRPRGRPRRTQAVEAVTVSGPLIEIPQEARFDKKKFLSDLEEGRRKKEASRG